MTTIDFQSTSSSPGQHVPLPPDAACEAATADRQMNHNLVAVPTCAECKTDAYLYIEAYKRPLVNDDGALAELGETSYFCTR